MHKVTGNPTVPVEASASHCSLVLDTWNKVQAFFCSPEKSESVLLTGNALDIASVVAVARFGVATSIQDSGQTRTQVDDSVKYLEHELSNGASIYGVTTGFGGSADTRTSKTSALQRGLLQHHLVGILPLRDGAGFKKSDALFNGDTVALLSMPDAWVRGAMLVRSNSLIRGHSAVRMEVIETIVKLVRFSLTPIVPLRGSISASGDLTPLCYIAGAVDGNKDVYLRTKQDKIVSADEGLASAGMQPVALQAKESLGVLNGTAFSAAVGSMAIYEANNLAVISQILTAMTVETLLGTAESFHPFIADVRPHKGQKEAAKNMRQFLEGSKLATFRDTNTSENILRQDRYATRTASQWIGPQLEDLELATAQITTELNSTTDNPLIDVKGQTIHHGGNFQAAAVTSAMEKSRLALQMLGRMMFAQSAELLDVTRNNGLPPNLAPDEPSLSYLMKGVDINMAAYCAELGFLASPVSTHVQTAEMGNQAINSMALVSARYTHMAVDVLSLMAAAHLYCLCQALDLRAMQAQFESEMQITVASLTSSHLRPFLPVKRYETVQTEIVKATSEALTAFITRDSSARFKLAATRGQATVIPHLIQDADQHTEGQTSPIVALQRWSSELAVRGEEIFHSTREAFYRSPSTESHLGMASKRMYAFVRDELCVPFHRGLEDYPVGNQHKGAIDAQTNGDVPEQTTNGVFETRTHVNGEKLANPGTWISLIYDALRSGRLLEPAMDCLQTTHSKVEIHTNGVDKHEGHEFQTNNVEKSEETEIPRTDGKNKYEETRSSADGDDKHEVQEVVNGEGHLEDEINKIEQREIQTGDDRFIF